MWPVAPKISHTFCLGGFVELGGSVVDGSWSFGLVSYNTRRAEGLGTDMLIDACGVWHYIWRCMYMQTLSSRHPGDYIWFMVV